jgi:hypothetical protein
VKRIIEAITVVSFLTVLFSQAPSAQADPRRVVVLQFQGPRPWVDVARRVVIGLVEDHHDIVPLERFLSAGRRLDVVTYSPRKIALVARHAKVDAIVEGEVEGGDEKRVLVLSVREARSGRVVDTLTIPVASAKLLSEKDELGDELLDLLESAEPLDESDAGWGAESADGPSRSAPLVVSSLAESTTGAPAVIEREGEAAKKRPAVFALTAGVGVAASQRKLTFVAQQSIPTDTQPQGIDGNPGAGLALSGSALVIPAGLMATFSFERSLGARLGYRDGGMVKSLSVSMRQLSVGLRGGKKIKGVGLHLGMGYREIAYLISNRPGTLLVPDARYALFELGGGIRIPFKKDVFAISAEGGYLQALSTSGITDMSAYGKAGVTGWRADAAVEVRATDTMTVRLGADYTHVGLVFEGSGRLAHGLDDDPGVDVAGATDSYFGGYLLVGFLL